MILTKLQGGLGNQLFQWAVSKKLSLKYNCDYYFETSYFNNDEFYVSKWKLELDKFDIDIKKLNIEHNLNEIKDDFNFQEIPDNVFLDGYWQSEKYFIDYQKNIRSCLSIKSEMKSYILSKYSFLTEDTISLHVRRGDYLNLQNYHPIQTIDYYSNAYDIINDSNINVVVLSNDINWCKDNLKFKNIYFIENETNITDLYIMSMCSHNIIANSSFSWWGAWLNNNFDKKVIAPSKWFGPESKLYEGDIIPENWIKI